MGKITPKLTLTGTAADFGNVISLEATTNLTIIEPFVGFSRITATTTGNESIIVPSLNDARYVYIRHAALNQAGAAETSAKVKVETADGTAIMELKANEFAFFPFYVQGASLLQLETDSGTVQVEYAFFRRA